MPENEIHPLIVETLATIRNQIGLELALCDHFTGVRHHNGRKFFNVILDKRTGRSREFLKLERLVNTSNIISLVEPNGLKRVAIYF